jgi:UPF0755 protein
MKKVIFSIILIILFALAGWVFCIVFISQSGKGETKLLTIKEGEGVHQISKDLKKEGLIDNTFVFETYVWLIGGGTKILAGDHMIYDKWSIKNITRVLISGSSLENETTIKIIEGWNLRDIAAYLEKQGICTTEEFFNAAGRPTIDYNLDKTYARPQDFSNGHPILADKPKNYGYEGFLFPDTYRIYKDAKPEAIVEKMINNFERKVNKEILDAITSSGRNLYDVITLASIVEKEAKTYEDKQRVAGVYYNRLKIGMALQADPTINYATGEITDRPTYDQIQIKSLYNTYKHAGLPPGPICNPGLDSIRAVVNPENNGYYYFLNTPDGKLIFSKTLEEHKRNRLKYFND